MGGQVSRGRATEEYHDNKNTNNMREVLSLKTKKYHQQSINVVIACNTNTTLISK